MHGLSADNIDTPNTCANTVDLENYVKITTDTVGLHCRHTSPFHD